MKKLILTLAITAIALGASAQTINVQSAIQDLKKGYLNKAKQEIDLACQHENTKNDAKTWYYAGMVYSSIGGESIKPKSKFKNLDPEWCEKAYAAALRCKELDTEGQFTADNNSVFRFVGKEFYDRATDAFNEEQNFAKAMELGDKAIQIFNNSGDKAFADDCYYLCGLCAKQLKDNEKMLSYYKPLVRRKTERNTVYATLYAYYEQQKDIESAVGVASKYVENCPNDYNSYLLMARANLLRGDVESGKKNIDEALLRSKDNPEVYARLLGAAAAILEENKDYEGAEAKYNESLTLTPNQYESNYGMGKMIFNRAVDKLSAYNEVPLDDESGLADKLKEEANGFFRQSIQYFNAAIAYIDGISDQQAKAMQRANLYNCLQALKTSYARLEMYDELKAINTRMAEIEAQK